MAALYFLGNASDCQMMGCVVQTENKTVVFDGGTWADAEPLAQFLKEYAHSHIDGWFFTHPHHDHLAAFLEIRRHYPEINVDQVFSHFPSIEMLQKYGYRTDDEMQLWIDFQRQDQCTKVQPDDVYVFDDISISVLRVYNPKITFNFANNSSTVYRIDGPTKRVLLLGDLGIEGGNDVMHTVPAKDLYADYTQMAHHGQNGVDFTFYEFIRPQACLWAAPDWLYNNDLGEGFDTGPFATVRTREWMDTLGVVDHIVQKDGTAKILL